MRGFIGALCGLVACSAAVPDRDPSRVRAQGSGFERAAPELSGSLGSAPPIVSPGTPEPRLDRSRSARAAEPVAVVERSGGDPLDDVATALRGLPPDPAPERTTNGIHYLVSNERRHDLFRPELDDLGGVMLAVGSDQSYVMTPWARTELLVVVDFDQKVVDLHGIYGTFMAASATVEEFRRLWSAAGSDDAHAVLRDATDDAHRALRLALYDEARPSVDKRLRTLARRYAELGVDSYLDTPAHYRFIADLHARGRVVALRGDFTHDGLLRELAAALRAHGQRVRVLYLSNIEQYLSYRKAFKANIGALPFDPETWVLRTLPGRPAGFHYLLQRGEDFHAWLRTPRTWSVYRLRGYRKGEPLGANERFVIGPPPLAAGD